MAILFLLVEFSMEGEEEKEEEEEEEEEEEKDVCYGKGRRLRRVFPSLCHWTFEQLLASASAHSSGEYACRHTPRIRCPTLFIPLPMLSRLKHTRKPIAQLPAGTPWKLASYAGNSISMPHLLFSFCFLLLLLFLFIIV